MTVKEYLKDGVSYNSAGPGITINNKEPVVNILGFLKGKNSIKKLFDNDIDAAMDFEDELGEWIADAINQKLNK
jgi:hypothetical protein